MQEEPKPVLSDDSGVASRPRVSRLAIAALPAAILCCPCLVGALVQPIITNPPRALVDTGVYPWVLRWGGVTMMLALTAVPLAAVVRVWISQGRRSGMGLAVAALSLTLLWWLLLLLPMLIYPDGMPVPI
jgi:hypothetical protein